MNQEQRSNVVDVIQQIIDFLYQENLKPAYMLLATVLPQLEQIIGEIEDENLQKEIVEKLTEAMTALEEQDSILLADLLQYEILEKIK